MITEFGQGKYYLYRHIRLDTGKPFYIGIGTKQEVYRPYRRAYMTFGRNSYWKKIINKTDYEVEIILESNNLDFIKQKEIEFISLYKLKCDGGTLCNLTYGGELTIMLEETKQKIKQSKQNISEETKRKMSESAKKKFVSEETKERLRKTSIVNRITPEMREKARLKNKGLKRSEEFKIQMSLRRSRQSNIKKRISSETLTNVLLNYKNSNATNSKILVFDLDNNFLFSFDNVKDASKWLNISKQSIVKVLEEKQLQTHTLKFKYETL